MLASVSRVVVIAPKSVLESHQASEAGKLAALRCVAAFFGRTDPLPPEQYVANMSYFALILDGRIAIVKPGATLPEEIRVALVETMRAIIACSPAAARELLQR